MLALPTLTPKLALLGAALSLALGGYGGWKLRDADYQEHLKRDAQEDAQWQKSLRLVEGEADRIVQEVRDWGTVEKSQVEVRYRTIEKRIPEYVTRTVFEERVVASGGLPAGLVWLHNQAAAGGSPVPLPSGLDPDAPTGLGVSDLAGVLTRNYALYQQCSIDLQAWGRWYDQQLALAEKEIK